MEKYSMGPMPENIRKTPKKWRPQHPPLTVGESLEEVTLTYELFKILDAESQEWWGGAGLKEGLERRIAQLKKEETNDFENL